MNSLPRVGSPLDYSSSLEAEQRLKELENLAENYSIDRNHPIRRYFQSGSEMLKMANSYYNDGDDEKAYIFYFRYTILFAVKIQQHPEYKKTVTVDVKKQMLSNLKPVLSKCEELKGRLSSQYDREHALYQREVETRRRLEEEKALELERVRKAVEGQKLSEEIAKYHQEKDRSLAEARDREVAIWHQLRLEQELEDEAAAAVRDKEVDKRDLTRRPDAEALLPVVDRGSKPASSTPAVPDRSTKPSAAGPLSTGGGLRMMRIPEMLVATFLSVADSNTARNTETGGILAGKLSQGMLHITHLIIPKQTGTADSCVTKNEEEVWEAQDKHDVISLGWIHTHPSQTAFLSSVDLHMQLGYQLMLPEAIAVVCAPSYNETGYFTLTQNYGLDFLNNCRQSGFHPHPSEPPLYESAKNVEFDSDGDITLIDLR